MARIRTIKPDFWTDEKITECSLSARLLFIGTWNFADDEGNLQASAKKLKMQIFPADNIDCQPLLDELITHGLLIEYSVNDEKFLHIKGFKKHQVINRPSKSNIPHMPVADDSLSTHGVLIDGREGKGREDTTDTDVSVVGNEVANQSKVVQLNPTPNCPHLEIIALYHELIPVGTRVKVWNGTRAAHLKARWNEDKKRQNLDYWKRFFTYCTESPFLMGKINGKDRLPFQISLAWIVMPNNFAKIIEQTYHREQA